MFVLLCVLSKNNSANEDIITQVYVGLSLNAQYIGTAHR